MKEKGIPCLVIDRNGQSLRCKFGASTEQRCLLGRLGFISDPQLLWIAITGACEGGSDTLTTGVSSEIALLLCPRRSSVAAQFRPDTKLSPPALEASLGKFAAVYHDVAVFQRCLFPEVTIPSYHAFNGDIDLGWYGVLRSETAR